VVARITRPGKAGDGKEPDRIVRQAALWATAVALPIAVLVGFLAFARLSPDGPTAQPTPTATAPRPQPSTPVPMAAPALPERSATVCRALVSRLPATVRDLPRRPVTAGAEQNAAYGEPPLTVTCGTPTPSFAATDDVWVVNRVCWHAADRSDAVVLTTVDREVPVQVSVPRAYEQPLQWAAPISESIVAAVPSAQSMPAGCRG
jgi:hypothetical protein